VQQVVPDPSPELLQRAGDLRSHAQDLAQCSNEQRREALLAMAAALDERRELILEANRADRAAAETAQLSPALMARLKLDSAKLDGAIAGLRQLAALSDPLG